MIEIKVAQQLMYPPHFTDLRSDGIIELGHKSCDLAVGTYKTKTKCKCCSNIWKSLDTLMDDLHYV